MDHWIFLILKIAAHACIAGGLTVWINMARGWVFNADQIIGLTALLTASCLIVDELIRRFVARQSRQIDIRSFFEEV